MPALRKSVPLILVLALLGQGANLRAEVRRSGVAGRVVGEANPLTSAHIYAYQLADLSLRKVMTDGQGNFLFQDLPAGLYKIIAHKSGFMPAVIMLTRTTAQAYQFLEVQLAQRQAGQGADGDDYWAIRARVPADVLHQIEISEAEEHTVQLDGLGSFGAGSRVSLPSGFKTDVQALTGVDQIAAEGGGQMSGAGLGFKGRVGDTKFDLRGRIFQVSPNATYQPSGSVGAGTGQTSSLAINLARGPNSRVSIQSFNNRMITRGESGRDAPVDLEHYQVNWTQGVGENGRSEIAARYTTENNFHHQAAIDPLDIPETSRTWNVEAAYTETFSDRSSLQGGLRYRERQFGLGDADVPGNRTNQRQALERRPVQPRRRPGPARGAHGVRPVQHALGRQPVLDAPGRGRAPGQLRLAVRGLRGPPGLPGPDGGPRLPPLPLSAARPLRAGERVLLSDEPDTQGGDGRLADLRRRPARGGGHPPPLLQR